MSSGERKRMMVKPCACDHPAGVARAVLFGARSSRRRRGGAQCMNRSGSRIPWDGGPQRVTAP